MVTNSQQSSSLAYQMWQSEETSGIPSLRFFCYVEDSYIISPAPVLEIVQFVLYISQLFLCYVQPRLNVTHIVLVSHDPSFHLLNLLLQS